MFLCQDRKHLKLFQLAEKEAKERLAMVSKKALQRLKRELLMIVSHIKTIKKKMKELDDLGDGSLSEEEKEFKSLVAATECVESLVKNVKTEEELESSKKAIKSIIDRMQDLRKRLAEFEEKFQRYNIPKICDSKTLLDYLHKLQEFMKVWKQEVEKGREKGEKSLIEWLKQLGQSDQERRKSTLREMKHVVIKPGIQISQRLIEYFLLMTFSTDRNAIKRRLHDVDAMLRYLSMEKNSIIIKRFLCVVKFVERIMRESKKCSTDNIGEVSYDVTEVQVHHLILREVLRLEVAFRCPDLPMMLIDDVYKSLGSHLLQVFEDKLKKVDCKMNELKMELLCIRDRDDDPKTWNLLKQKLDMGIEEIWKSLDL